MRRLLGLRLHHGKVERPFIVEATVFRSRRAAPSYRLANRRTAANMPPQPSPAVTVGKNRAAAAPAPTRSGDEAVMLNRERSPPDPPGHAILSSLAQGWAETPSDDPEGTAVTVGETGNATTVQPRRRHHHRGHWHRSPQAAVEHVSPSFVETGAAYPGFGGDNGWGGTGGMGGGLRRCSIQKFQRCDTMRTVDRKNGGRAHLPRH